MACIAVGPMESARAGNTPPSGTPKTVSLTQNGSYVFQAADFGFSDASDSPPDAFITVKITTLPALGSLTLNGVGVVAGQLVSVADISAGQLAFTPALNGYGSPYAGFSFQVLDNGSGNSNTVSLLTGQTVIASDLNATGFALASLPTPTYPQLQVAGQYLSGKNSWGTYQPPLATATTTLFGASVAFPTRYLDEIGPLSARTVSWTFRNGSATPVTAASLATTTKTFTYVVGVAGLGGGLPSETLNITSNVTLTVIGNGNAFGSNWYSLLDGVDTGGAMGLTGTVISTHGITAQGYTFFSLPANASSVTLTESGDDAHGVVLGVVETSLLTVDPTPRSLNIDVLPAVVNGSCGAAEGVTLSFIPDANLCAAGSAGAVTRQGDQWAWSCGGAFGGATASCLAPVGPTGTNTGPVSAVVGAANGWVIDRAASAGFIPVSGDPASPSVPPPAGVSFPQGLFDVDLISGAAGTATEVTITYPNALPAGSVYYKFGPTQGNAQPHWYVYPHAVISGQTVTLTLTDGQDGDRDLLANSHVHDPGGPGVSAASPGSIPTLDRWGLALLGLLMVAVLALMRALPRRVSIAPRPGG